MTLTRDSIISIEAKAGDVLQSSLEENERVDLPVDLGKITQQFGLRLKIADFDDPEVIGKFDRKEKVIYIAKGTPFNRMAFTIAHELGHYILHASKEKETFLRLNIINLDKQDEGEEQEANWFAASLLMPRESILEYWQLTKDIGKIATFFGVSRIAMHWRLKNLGLLN